MPSNQLLAVMDAAVDAVVLIDSAGIIQAFNSAAERIFGWHASEACGRNVSLLMPEPDGSAHDGYLARYLATGESRVIGEGRELQARRRDGSTFPAHLSVGRVAGSQPVQFVGFIRDISAQQAILAKIQFERDLAGAYLQLGHSILVMLDAECRIRAISPQACDLLGRNEAQLVGKSWKDAAFATEEHERLDAELKVIERCSPGDIHVFELAVCGAGGDQRLVEWRCGALHGPSQALVGFICAGRDVTAQRAGEDQARRSTERLMNVSRLATMGEMAAGIAHELNQPLSAIANYAYASQRFLNLPQPDLEETRDAVREIAAEALRAGAIIRRLRHMVRGNDDMREALNLEDVIDELRLLTQADARAHDTRIRFEIEVSPPLFIHRIQIVQALLNLIRNAMESLGSDAPQNREIVVRSRQLESGDCEISVCDNGPGIPADIAERMFDPFYSTKRNGTGLGLPMSQTIAQAHGGSVRYEPGMLRGACFILKLPVVEAAA